MSVVFVAADGTRAVFDAAVASAASPVVLTLLDDGKSDAQTVVSLDMCTDVAFAWLCEFMKVKPDTSSDAFFASLPADELCADTVSLLNTVHYLGVAQEPFLHHVHSAMTRTPPDKIRALFGLVDDLEPSEAQAFAIENTWVSVQVAKDE